MNGQTHYSFRNAGCRMAFKNGLKDGIPIGIGYFAVSFSLGIAAKHAGLTPAQGFLASLLCNASAGEYAGFSLIVAGGTYIQIAIITLIANARYLLMSCAMSQRMRPGTSWVHRAVMAFDITDELFAIAISRPGYLNPYYTYGAVVTAAPCWAIGTALGCLAGNLLPLRIVSALSVALFGMFLAVIIPPARESKVIAGLVLICFVASYGVARLPGVSQISEGTRIIVLTLVLSAMAAILFPRKGEGEAPSLEESAADEERRARR